jgi:hypothetical protein
MVGEAVHDPKPSSAVLVRAPRGHRVVAGALHDIVGDQVALIFIELVTQAAHQLPRRPQRKGDRKGTFDAAHGKELSGIFTKFSDVKRTRGG